MWSPSRCIPYARNARVIPDSAVGKVAASIKEFGFKQPIVVDAGGVIIAGHTRLLAAERLGLAEVPVLVADDLSPAQVKAYRLADNRTGQEATWDMELLGIELEDLAGLDIDLSLTGFDAEELLDLGGDAAGPIVEDEAPEPPEDPITKPGDLWLLGEHRVLCGDSTDDADVAILMGGASSDCVFTSPPYNVGIKYSDHDDEMGGGEYEAMMRAVMTRCYESMAPGRVIAWNVGVSPKSRPYGHALWLEDSGFTFYRHIVWKKTGAQIPLWQNSRKDPSARHYLPNYNHELVYMASKGPVELGAATTMPDELQMDVWDVCQFSAGGHDHPAAFPVKLAALGTGVLTATGEVILDPFLGSGTTLIAAEQTGRICYGMEIDAKYTDVIVLRWQALTGREATLEATGQTFDAVSAHGRVSTHTSGTDRSPRVPSSAGRKGSTP